MAGEYMATASVFRGLFTAVTEGFAQCIHAAVLRCACMNCFFFYAAVAAAAAAAATAAAAIVVVASPSQPLRRPSFPVLSRPVPIYVPTLGEKESRTHGLFSLLISPHPTRLQQFRPRTPWSFPLRIDLNHNDDDDDDDDDGDDGDDDDDDDGDNGHERKRCTSRKRSPWSTLRRWSGWSPASWASRCRRS